MVVGFHTRSLICKRVVGVLLAFCPFSRPVKLKVAHVVRTGIDAAAGWLLSIHTRGRAEIWVNL